MMNDREKRQEAWTTAVAEAGQSLGLVAGVFVYLGDEPGDVEARSFIVDKFSHGTRDAILEAMSDAIDNMRKQLASPNN